MTKEGIDVIPETKPMATILDNDSILLISESDFPYLVPENDSSPKYSQNIEPKVGHARRYSTGNISIPYTEVKILSRYLSASTGSCHDYCKYGIKKAAEAKATHPMLKRFKNTQVEAKDMEKSVTLADRKKKWVVGGMLFASSKSQKPEIHVATKREVPSSNNKGQHSVKRVSSMNIEKFKNRKVASHLKDQNDAGKAISEKSSKDVLKKTLQFCESNSKNRTVRPSQNGDYAANLFPEDRSLKRIQHGTHTARLASPSAKNILSRTQIGMHATRPQTSFKNKDLRCTKDGTHVIGSFKSTAALASSKSGHSNKFSENCQIETENRVVNGKVGLKAWPRKGGVICRKDEDPPARKLNFRTEKVAKFQPEIGTPRRLKFRRRVLSERQNDKAETISSSKLKNTGIDGKINVAKTESEKVALSCQNIKGKKVVKFLLDNVIKETASKLVKTRKSKVKALVGAFETVISLQDSRPSSTVSAH